MRFSWRNLRTMDIVRNVYREGGIRGFYKGNRSIVFIYHNIN